MGNDEGGLLDLLNHIGHGKGFSGAGDAQQGFKLVSLLQALHQFFNGSRLVPHGGIIRMQFKFSCKL